MTAPDKCPQCGAPLTADGMRGQCLRCLLLLGMAAPEPLSSAEEFPPLAVDDTVPGEEAGRRIGPYALLKKIGEGGCGVVFLAEQFEPVRRRVALKIIKLGMDTKQVIARFKFERQTLALMDHPHIAKILDAGATGTGRLFFVMELVEGIKITDYCDEHKLTIRERLELFRLVCQAVQHAHQKGVIHRDIKPSNVLVAEKEGAPVPKIIDFGIAKASAGDAGTDATIFTAFEQFIGTPAYMSPEQAAMGAVDIDTRSDIYSLGVLLYELLAGKPPFDSSDLRRCALDEVIRTIRQQEPMCPSVSLARLGHEELAAAAGRRRLESGKFVKTLAGDLDWIVMKALEKDRDRRYETAAGLAGDAARFLKDEPIMARPPSRAYQLRKWARRNKFMFAAASVLIIASLATSLSYLGSLALSAYRMRQKFALQVAAAQLDRQRERFDAFEGFSRRPTNPAGAWSYLWSSSLDSPQAFYALNIQQDANTPGWPHAWTRAWAATAGEIPIPLVAANITGSPLAGFPTNLLFLHPGWHGEFSHVIWTAPVSARYSISGAFRLLDSEGNIIGYVIHRKRTGSVQLSVSMLGAESSTSHFSEEVELREGEQIDFAVGCGPRGPDLDTTVLSAIISRQPKNDSQTQ